MNKTIIKKIILESLNQEIFNIKQVIGKGDVNQIFVIQINSGKYILRINQKSDGFSEFAKERWCIEQAQDKGVLGPNILDIGKYQDFSYMIYDFIEGKSGDQIENKLEAWIKLGEYAKAINNIKVNGYGLKFSSKQNKFLESWNDYINYNLKSLNQNDKLLHLKVYDLKQLKIIKQYFHDLKNQKHKIGLVHNDLSLRNVIVNQSNKIYLIDWGCAEANIIPHSEFVEILGAGHMDLAVPTQKQIDAFLQGYEISQIEFKPLEKEVAKFLLLKSFDKLRWAIDKSSKDTKEFAKIAKKRLNYSLKVNKNSNV
jgi:fructosamine-3-kinase